MATTGSSGNNGTSPATPWDLATGVAYAAPAGTCINIATGVYSNTGTSFTHGGISANANGYVVWRCSTMPFSFSSSILQGEGTGCVFRASTSGAGTMIATQAPYLMFDAIEIDGNSLIASNVCIGANLASNGVNGTLTYHHVWFINGDIHGCGQSGVQWNASEYIWLVHSVAHDNAGNSGFNGSGVSIYEPVSFAAGTYTPTGVFGSSAPAQDNYWCISSGNCFHWVFVYNLFYHNYNPQVGSANTDGEGIILDTFDHSNDACPGGATCPVTAPALVMGNLAFNNGGAGIETFSSISTGTHFWIVNNTNYSNNWDTHHGGGQPTSFLALDIWNTTWINNIGISSTGCSAGFVCGDAPFYGNGSTNSNNLWQTNIASPAGRNFFQGTLGNGSPPGDNYPTVGTNHNLDTSVSPLGALTPNSNTNNYALPGGSQAIGFGQAFGLWQQTIPGAIDAGACVSSLTSCP